jgi:hypothetical protein
MQKGTSVDKVPRIVYATFPPVLTEKEKLEERSQNDVSSSSLSHSNLIGINNSKGIPTTTTLTITSLRLHENALRIEKELQLLEKQIQKLQEQDQILFHVQERINQITTPPSPGMTVSLHEIAPAMQCKVPMPSTEQLPAYFFHHKHYAEFPGNRTSAICDCSQSMESDCFANVSCSSNEFIRNGSGTNHD